MVGHLPGPAFGFHQPLVDLLEVIEEQHVGQGRAGLVAHDGQEAFILGGEGPAGRPGQGQKPQKPVGGQERQEHQRAGLIAGPPQRIKRRGGAQDGQGGGQVGRNRRFPRKVRRPGHGLSGFKERKNFPVGPVGRSDEQPGPILVRGGLIFGQHQGQPVNGRFLGHIFQKGTG